MGRILFVALLLGTLACHCQAQSMIPASSPIRAAKPVNTSILTVDSEVDYWPQAAGLPDKLVFRITTKGLDWGSPGKFQCREAITHKLIKALCQAARSADATVVVMGKSLTHLEIQGYFPVASWRLSAKQISEAMEKNLPNDLKWGKIKLYEGRIDRGRYWVPVEREP
jgi:hypothetical protein